ncbi:MAG: cysteine hydrolase [Myxococcales bacterium]|nr:cysteine hydrolase [Myxococcales bacterium]
MPPPDDDDPTVDLALSQTPRRLLDAVLPARSLADEVNATREALAEYALATTTPASPPVDLRARLANAIAARPVVARRALVVVDMIQDYLTPGRPLFVPRAREIIGALADRVGKARRDGEPVVFVHDFHEEGDTDLEHWPLHATAGTTGWQMVDELAPVDGDLLVPHRTYSGFFETDLHEQLSRLSVGTLEITGCATELQVFTTAADALMRGYRVEVPEGLHAGTTEELERAAMKTLSVMRPVPPKLAAR